jgi:hypothetical protein
VTPERELRHVRAEDDSEPVPVGHQLDELRYPGGQMVLAKAREVMTAVLSGGTLPTWFTSQCVDDRAIQTCTLERWSLRAWKYWLEPENRRWWWWAAESDGEEIRFNALVRERPYLRGSIDWLFKASVAADAGPNARDRP